MSPPPEPLATSDTLKDPNADGNHDNGPHNGKRIGQHRSDKAHGVTLDAGQRRGNRRGDSRQSGCFLRRHSLLNEIMEAGEGIEPPASGAKPDMRPLHHPAIFQPLFIRLTRKLMV